MRERKEVVRERTYTLSHKVRMNERKEKVKREDSDVRRATVGEGARKERVRRTTVGAANERVSRATVGDTKARTNEGEKMR